MTSKLIKFKNCDCQVPAGKLDVNNLPLGCQATWRMISAGRTIGIFQLEKKLGQDWAKKVKPSNILELAALGALLRPGCLESGISDEYVDVKFGRKQKNYLHPKLEPILDDTYGQMVYQEQAIKICSELAGFNLAQSDNMRKAIGKKKPELMAKLKTQFIGGCIDNKIDEKIAEQIFGWIEKSQRYSFNLSHAVSYAMIGYQTAWIKCHCPYEFFTSWLSYSSRKGDPKQEIYHLVQDAKWMGIKILPPDIRRANVDFETVKEPERGVAFGLSHIRGVGHSAIDKVVEASKGNLESWTDFLKSISIMHRNVSLALIKSGACDHYGYSRMHMSRTVEILFGFSARTEEGNKQEIRGLTDNELNWLFEELDQHSSVVNSLQNMLENAVNNKNIKQMKKEELINFLMLLKPQLENDANSMRKQDIIDAIYNNGYKEPPRKRKILPKRRTIIEQKIEDLKNIPTEDNRTRAAAERHFLGISLSCSAADDADNSLATHTCLEAAKSLNDERITICCIIDKVKHTKTKRGKNPGQAMCFLTVSDSTYSIDYAVIFPDLYKKIRGLCREDLVILLYGEKKNGSIIVQDIEKLI